MSVESTEAFNLSAVNDFGHALRVEDTVKYRVGEKPIQVWHRRNYPKLDKLQRRIAILQHAAVSTTERRFLLIRRATRVGRLMTRRECSFETGSQSASFVDPWRLRQT